MSDKITVPVSLKSLLVPSKTVEAEYPGFGGFKVQLSFLSRETLVSIRKKSTKNTFKNRNTVEELNDELFLQLYVSAAVKGWTGLKLQYLELLVPVELEGMDKEDSLEFSEENALFLMKNSSDFDAWVSDMVTSLGNFQNSNAKK